MTPVVKHPNPSITGPLYLQEKVKPEPCNSQSKEINVCLCTPEITFHFAGVLLDQKKKKVEIE